jgi:HlyD family secretion protein
MSAKANLTCSQVKRDRMVNGSRPEEIKAADATVKRLQNEETLAKTELTRMEELLAKSVATRDELDRSRAAYESALQSRENAGQTLTLLRLGNRKEDIDLAEAEVGLAVSRVAEAQAALDKAQSDLDRCCVQAPFDGWVVRRCPVSRS